MRTSLLPASVLVAALAAAVASDVSAAPAAQGEIDSLVFARLSQLGIQPAPLCSDEVFVRRAYLDAIGTLPTAGEVRQFLSDRNPDKRAGLIDRLLERDEFADYWAMKWVNLLRVKSEFPINLWPNAVQAYHRWIRTAIKENMPYDRFVRELLTASGSNIRAPQVNFYRAVQSRTPEGIARAVALTFMGARAENWPTNRLAGMAVFFSRVGYKTTAEWKEEVVYFDLAKETGPASATFPDGKTVALSPMQDPRKLFADWLACPDNPWFARNISNRVWYWLMGRGIIHEPDDIRPDNPPCNPDLLSYLERELAGSGYNLKHLFRMILYSCTYQLSSLPAGNNPQGEADFAFYPVRRLEAEVLIDAINQITGATEKYVSHIPEPFTYMPEEQRAVALADASVTSPFLELFGRSPRNTGLESEQRNSLPTAAQQLHLLNSTHIRNKLEQSAKLRALPGRGAEPGAAVTELYLTILSRLPTAEERAVVQAYEKAATNQQGVGLDLAWALINNAEFQFRH
jgi:hypothetical protein